MKDNKKQWQAPKVFDLDVKETQAGTAALSYELVTTLSWSYYATS